MTNSTKHGLLSERAYEHCELCPRRCGVNRLAGARGVCGETATMRAARAALHLWEEPPISGTAADEELSPTERDAGSGTIFFSGCPLRCVYCQNHEVSQEGAGVALSVDDLARTMLALEAEGALNVNLVTALHFAPSVARAVRRAREQGLSIPIVANTSGYERAELVRALAGVVDVWLTDFKYASPELAARLSSARDYPGIADEALRTMMDVTAARGGRTEDDAGHLTRGVVIRHLMLPGETSDTFAVLERVRAIVGDEADLSLMNQYTPNAACRAAGGALAGAVDDEDYEAALAYAYELGFPRVWWQEPGTVSESFVPAFDGTGLTTRASWGIEPPNGTSLRD